MKSMGGGQGATSSPFGPALIYPTCMQESPAHFQMARRASLNLVAFDGSGNGMGDAGI